MARKTITRVVSIRPFDGDMAGFLDMLRYDNATVVDWTTVTPEQGMVRYEVTLRSAPDRTPGFEFTTDRWASFGLHLREVGA